VAAVEVLVTLSNAVVGLTATIKAQQDERQLRR